MIIKYFLTYKNEDILKLNKAEEKSKVQFIINREDINFNSSFRLINFLNLKSSTFFDYDLL